jgi:hypothetical protein
MDILFLFAITTGALPAIAGLKKLLGEAALCILT